MKTPAQRTAAAAAARRISLPVAAIVEDYAAGITIRAIATKYGVNWVTIRNRLVYAGVIEPRDEWEREAVQAASIVSSGGTADSS
jgi:uncharacterized protein (DUF433 family)